MFQFWISLLLIVFILSLAPIIVLISLWASLILVWLLRIVVQLVASVLLVLRLLQLVILGVELVSYTVGVFWVILLWFFNTRVLRSALKLFVHELLLLHIGGLSTFTFIFNLKIHGDSASNILVRLLLVNWFSVVNASSRHVLHVVVNLLLQLLSFNIW